MRQKMRPEQGIFIETKCFFASLPVGHVDAAGYLSGN